MMLLPIGSLLQNGKYRIEAVLSQRDWDATYRATHTELNQSVVLKARKAFEVENFAIEALTERFLVEAKSLIQLRHPHIGPVMDCFVEDQCPYLVMDFIAGETFAQKVAQASLPETDAIAYIRQVGSGLAFVHGQRVLHRDVKPSHIMVQAGTQDAILIGFGVAHGLNVDEMQVNPESLSDGFAALEQYLPNHPWSPATDVYGLAATLYTLTTGQVPVAAILRDRSRSAGAEPTPLVEPRGLNPNLSLQVEEAILRGMALDVSHRPTTVESWLALLPGNTSPDATLPNATLPNPAALDPSTGQPNRDAMSPTVLETVIEPSELPAPSAETSPPMPKQKPPVARQKAPIRKFISTPAGMASGKATARQSFPRQALVWSAAIAGLGGIAFGLFLKTRLFTPLPSPQSDLSPSPQQTIEESFPPKERPQVYETPADTITPEPTATLPPEPSNSVPTNQPIIEGGGEISPSPNLSPFDSIQAPPPVKNDPTLVDPPVHIPDDTQLKPKRSADLPPVSPPSPTKDASEFLPQENVPSDLAGSGSAGAPDSRPIDIPRSRNLVPPSP